MYRDIDSFLGSPKQRRWAFDIYNNLNFDGISDHPSMPESKIFLLSIRLCRFWIKNRHMTGKDFIIKMMTDGLDIMSYGMVAFIDKQDYRVYTRKTNISIDGKSVVVRRGYTHYK